MTLTARQLEVSRCLARGMTQKEIARHLGISFDTVKFHIGEAVKRAGARNRTHLAVLVDRLDARSVSPR